ncbi:MAG: RluA family pseudouridine synthase [Treponema sp.]|nr:RluA family pseudouridine synthase [Treponema sp.]
MEFKKFTCGTDDDNRRLDKILRRLLPTKKTSELYQAIRKGLVKINDKKAAPEYRVAAGDYIHIASFLIEQSDSVVLPAPSNHIHLDYILKNEHIVIINKPYDISVQGKDSIAQAITHTWQTSTDTHNSLSFRPGPLHRLDKKTTGVLVCSQSLQGSRWFSQAIATHIVQKDYIAIVQGTLAEKQTWQDLLTAESDNKTSPKQFHTVNIETSHGKTAITHAFPLAHGIYNNIPVTLVQYRIETGRKHQIRAQSSHHGYPLLGDSAYGGIAIHEDQDIYLHAYQITLPADNPIELPPAVQAPISTNFQKMLNKTLLKWNGLLIV